MTSSTETINLLSSSKVADILGVSVITVRRWARQRKLECYKYEKEFRFDLKAIEEFIRRSVY